MPRRATLTRPTPPTLSSEPRALTLDDVCQRLGFSSRTGRKLVAEGRFPIPALPMVGLRRHRYSSVHVDDYLRRVHPLEDR